MWGAGRKCCKFGGPGVRARLGTWRLSPPRAAGMGTRGLRASRHPQKAAGPGVQRAVGGSRAQQERVGGGAHQVSSLWSKGRRAAAWVGKGR